MRVVLVREFHAVGGHHGLKGPELYITTAREGGGLDESFTPHTLTLRFPLVGQFGIAHVHTSTCTHTHQPRPFGLGPSSEIRDPPGSTPPAPQIGISLGPSSPLEGLERLKQKKAGVSFPSNSNNHHDSTLNPTTAMYPGNTLSPASAAWPRPAPSPPRPSPRSTSGSSVTVACPGGTTVTVTSGPFRPIEPGEAVVSIPIEYTGPR